MTAMDLGEFDIIELAHVLGPDTLHGAISTAFRDKTVLAHAPFEPGPINDATITSGIDSFEIGAHTGTHVDALAHVARGGRLFGGTSIAGSIENPDVPLPADITNRPVVGRGVLLDFPRAWNVERVDGATRFSADDVKECAKTLGVELRNGDAILIRTGWDTLAADPVAFLEGPFPGPEQDAARLFVELAASAVGSDTMPFEAVPAEVPLEVHAILLVDAGIQILELLDLTELSRRGVTEFTFVLAPLRIAGGTGSPVAPLALVSR